MNQDLTYRQRQEWKAFQKSGKKRYFISSSTKILTPWLRTLHTDFPVTDLGIKVGDKVLVSLQFGDDFISLRSVTDDVAMYDHWENTVSFKAECLRTEFGEVPPRIYFTVESNNTYKGEDCGCGG